MFYATQNPEKFDLFKKADASECLQSILEIIHFCLNQNPNKKHVDDPCGQLDKRGELIPGTHCFIHENVRLNIFSETWCKCTETKARK